jgi:BNR repeat-containing family member
VVLSLAPAGAAAPRSIGSGAWSYFGDPRAVHAGGRTFVGWTDRRGFTHVAALDRNRLVAHRRFGPRFSTDDHNNPSLYVRVDGRIMVFYSAHNGGRMYYRVSAKPYSIARFSRPRAIGTNTAGSWGYTYPNPLRADGRLWLLFRGGNWQPNYTIRGARWSPARTLVRGPISRRRGDVLLGRGGRHRPYVKYASDGERIHAAFTEGHLGDYPNAIRYASFDRSGLYTASGRRIARLGAAPRVHELERVRAYSGFQQWALDIAASPFGPVIVYLRRTLRPEYWWARFDGRRWRNYRITRYGHTPRSPGAVGGATLDHEDPSIVYLSRLVPDRPGHEVEMWQTPDGGRSWRRRTITRSRTDDLRPISPRGLTRYSQVLWLSGKRTFWTSFSTRVLTSTPK